MISETPIEEKSRHEVLTMNVTLSGLMESEPPKMAFNKVLTLKNGSKRHGSQVVPVPDADLWRRLRAEVRPGDRIRVTIETDWGAEGLPTVLKDFCPIPDPDSHP
jgi:hypothetical protein